MWMAIFQGAFLIGSYIYHRLTEESPRTADSVEIPKTEVGAPITFLYGRDRIHKSVLVWTDDPVVLLTDGDTDYNIDGTTGLIVVYQLNMMFVLGIPFPNSDCRLWKMYAGEVPAQPAGMGLSGQIAGENLLISVRASNGVFSEGRVEFHDGFNDQELVNPITFAPVTVAGARITIATDATVIPGYRGYMLAFLSGRTEATGSYDSNWVIGTAPQPPSYSFEISSYPISDIYAKIGLEANPVDVIRDLVTGTFGQTGISPSFIDDVSFNAARITLYNEVNGYSRAIENAATVDEMVSDILKQIDGVLYEDPVDSLIKIKLIRADYNPLNAPELNPDNCKLENYAAGDWTVIPNKVVVIFENRENDYQDDTREAQNQAGAVGQDGIARPVMLEFRGVKTSDLALTLAGRELTACSRPITKTSAIVDRSFLRTVQGDVLSLVWPEYGVDHMMMRVANVTRGTLKDGAIKLDLIQDVFYTHRGAVTATHIPSFGGVSG